MFNAFVILYLNPSLERTIHYILFISGTKVKHAQFFKLPKHLNYFNLIII